MMAQRATKKTDPGTLLLHRTLVVSRHRKGADPHPAFPSRRLAAEHPTPAQQS
jgi:hypothetical protein